MFSLILFSLVISVTMYSSDCQPTSSPPDDTFAYAVDYQETAITSSQMRCLKASTYGLILVGAFVPQEDGFFDPNAVDTIKKAHSEGMRVEVHVHVKFQSRLTGAEQLDLVVNRLRASGISLKSVWILATTLTINDSGWPMFNQTASYLFLKSVMDRAKEHGITVGIYTNSYDWNKIISKRMTFGSDVLLWYYNVWKPGLNGETRHNFDDFSPFGPFENPTMKQFAHGETLCQLKISRNVYRADSLVPVSTISSPQSDKIIVGGNFKT